jgi:arylsulfatase A
VFRGHKADIYEGGHRVPLLVRWPSGAKKGARSEQLVVLSDLLRTCCEAAGVEVPQNAGEDSYSFLPVLVHRSPDAKSQTLRPAAIHHSINGSFAIREGDWKLCLCPGSGGWSAPRPGADRGLPPVQLFNLKEDIGEQKNVADQHPAIVERLTGLLKQQRGSGE